MVDGMVSVGRVSTRHDDTADAVAMIAAAPVVASSAGSVATAGQGPPYIQRIS